MLIDKSKFSDNDIFEFQKKYLTNNENINAIVKCSDNDPFSFYSFATIMIVTNLRILFIKKRFLREPKVSNLLYSSLEDIRLSKNFGRQNIIFKLKNITKTPSPYFVVKDTFDIKLENQIHGYTIYNILQSNLNDFINTSMNSSYKSFLEDLKSVRPNTSLKISKIMKMSKITRHTCMQFIKMLESEEKTYGRYIKLEDVFITSSEIEDLHDDIDNLIKNFDRLQNQKI